jgi:Nif-specific regulatory protein
MVETKYLGTIESYFDVNNYQEAYHYSIDVLKSSKQNTKEFILADAICKLCNYITRKGESTDINQNLTDLKAMNCLLDWAGLKQMEFEVYIKKNEKEAILRMVNELFEVEEIFKKFDVRKELERLDRIKAWILKEITQKVCARRISLEYLEVFSQIGEVIHRYLNDDSFIERLLDILIRITDSERGAFFLFEDSKLQLVAGRNVEQQTINDARKVSKSIIRKTRKNAEIICCQDAMFDPRFKKSKSVILNKIRSVICTPLKVRENIIGAIYLDSRFTCGLFSDEDKHFLLAVTYFIASIIERSRIFLKMKEKNVSLQSGKFTGAAREYLIGESPAIKEIREMIERIAETDSTVLLTGETGTGKGLVALLIHYKSTRKHGKFIVLSCGAVPETLLESELFGHKKGAFTGAVNDKKGLFEEADKGTLFLDDISNAPLSIQAKLLQAIEEKTIRRLGEIVERRVDIRLISATNQNLKAMINQGLFRPDLFYRISVLTIHIPPLRERTVDIPILSNHFLKKYASKFHRNIVGFDREALKKMLLYPWPGNVRELQNTIEGAINLTMEHYITTDDLKLTAETHTKKRFPDKQAIINVLKSAKGNVSLASRLLGIGRSTFYRYIRKHNINISENNQ